MKETRSDIDWADLMDQLKDVRMVDQKGKALENWKVEWRAVTTAA